MTNSLFLFGNGLGMSIDPHKFSLANAMTTVWNGKTLDDVQKNLVKGCLAVDGKLNQPKSENDLKTLQEILFVCEQVAEVETLANEKLRFLLNDDAENVGNFQLLTDEARKFPDAVRRYNRLVVKEFCGEQEMFNEEVVLKTDFVKELGEYICDTRHRTDVAVLNYDNLLYTAFNGVVRDVFKFYALSDGFSGKVIRTFDRYLTQVWMNKKANENQGWYMHLHGSPLFITSDGNVVKVDTNKLDTILDDPSHHIVLTYSAYKQKIIEKSPILRAYWDIFTTRLSGAQHIVLFGYSGCDPHVNDAINKNCPPNAKIRIVEWADPKATHQDRVRFWSEELGRQIKDCDVIRLDNIQEFRDWAMPT